MMYLVRTALSRDLGGMGNLDLYRHSHVGSKQLIEQYVDSTVQTIQALVEKSCYAGALRAGMEHQDLLEGMLYARQSFGRSALLLSGGGTFGMMHIGVVKAMFEAQLLPRIISGASAGSIVCAVLCSRTDEEIPALLHEFPYGDLDVFEDPNAPPGFLGHLKRLLIQGSWSDVDHLTRVLRALLGDITFQEAYNRTRRICNICVSSASIFELPRLLNYVTSPNVLIWSAVAASCSVPLVFQGSRLLIKDPATGEHRPWNPTPQRWIDGSVDNDLPMTRLAELFNVNHFIVSQVNPHVVPFLEREDGPYSDRHSSPSGKDQPFTASGNQTQDRSGWMATLATLAMDEALHRLHFLAEINLFSNVATKLRSVLSQKYSGDINILPQVNLADLPRILQNPTSEFMVRACLAGERATWPKLSRIRDRCAIELALDRAVHALRAKVVFSESQVDLRRLVTGSEELGFSPKGSVAGSSAAKPKAAAPMGAGQAGASLPTEPGLGPVAKEKLKGRQRRGSGSGIQLMARHRRVLQNLESALTDDETEEEERMALNVRRGAPGLFLPQNGRGPAASNNPQLRRVARSHGGLASMLRGMNGAGGARTGPTHVQGVRDRNGVEGFDFSRPMPMAAPAISPTAGPDVASDGVETAVTAGEKTPPGRAVLEPGLKMSRGLLSETYGTTPSPGLDVISPTEAASDVGDLGPRSSDGDGEVDADSNTELSISDPDPYDKTSL